MLYALIYRGDIHIY